MATPDLMEPDRPKLLFLTTRWTLVMAARPGQTIDPADALEELCRLYWFPVYAVVRRSGHNVEDARDLTQGFFEKLLEKNLLGLADREKGRFRTFLITALKRFLVNDWHHAHAAKRGGHHREIVPLDTAIAERLMARDGSHSLPPDQLFDRRWALTLLDTAMRRLASEYRDAGRTSEFETLKPCLTASRGEIDYPWVSHLLDINEGAARVAVHRLRKRYRQLFREEIARTVGDDDAEVDLEMRALLDALSGNSQSPG